MRGADDGKGGMGRTRAMVEVEYHRKGNDAHRGEIMRPCSYILQFRALLVTIKPPESEATDVAVARA